MVVNSATFYQDGRLMITLCNLSRTLKPYFWYLKILMLYLLMLWLEKLCKRASRIGELSDRKSDTDLSGCDGGGHENAFSCYFSNACNSEFLDWVFSCFRQSLGSGESLYWLEWFSCTLGSLQLRPTTI